MDVTLTWHEAQTAAVTGITRRIRAKARARTEVYGSPKTDPWAIDIEAACAERAAAKATGCYWNQEVDPDYPGDVGVWQVRHTPRADGCLILHERDSDESVFILVTGTMPTYRVCGWITAHEGKQPAHWREDTGRPAFFIPQAALRPMEELAP